MAYERFGSTLRQFREAAGLTLDEAASVLGYKGKTVGAWERGRLKSPPAPNDVNELARLFASKGVRVSGLDFAIALGFDADFGGLNEESFAVGRAFQEAPDGDRRIVRLALGVEPPQPRDEVGRSFHQ